MKAALWAYLLAIIAVPGLPAQGTQSPAGVVAAPDYAKPDSWVCRPGSDSVCTHGLDSKAIFPDGHTEMVPFSPAVDPAIDCFYLYPTVSQEDRDYADLTDSPEVQRVVKSQVGRLSSRCRVFAPIYRQATMKHLRDHLAGAAVSSSDVPDKDVSAAWNYYLQHDNHGRGVVLIGHSQGTILLQQLIAASIDGKAAQSLLVSAILAGNPSLGVPPGKLVGGTFQHIPLCRSMEETGCAYAWGSYLEGQAMESPIFGGARSDGLESACDNPAAPLGGKGLLRSVLPRPQLAPPDDPPYIDTIDQLSGACGAVGKAHLFLVTVLPGKYSERYAAMLQRYQRPGWGLHPLDVALVEGNILATLDAEIAHWRKANTH